MDNALARLQILIDFIDKNGGFFCVIFLLSAMALIAGWARNEWPRR